jgi:hypothetical protein
MDIRKRTCLIIRKDNEYLVGTILYSTDLRWSISPWDAWKTRIRAKAKSIAEKTSGEIMLFNPVAGQIREYRGE